MLRHAIDGGESFVAERLDAISHHLGERSAPLPIAELSVDDGYRAWAPTYDSMSNALIDAEEPLVRRALEDLEPGQALDAACGTGRHTSLLVEAGHATSGVDRSEAMLSVARAKVPDADFRVGDLENLPLETDSVDVAVCALALTHLAEPSAAIAEISRVTRPGGRIVLSDAHPSFVLIWGQALFVHGDGLAFVRNHVHLHSRYLEAFRSLGLGLTGCFEAPMAPDFATGLWLESQPAADALWSDLPAVLVWILEA